ncbi:cation-translocating P-type ATPase [Echinicola salinicaeni]|uniref:cation-translocating P-type ATPase n=1 Tax=Echinicola salinicaeni TaxID=2762757 RepID=UPI0016486B71|nr:cation-transporting P-type ATPase [Echinicola salinicaeni]
MKAPYQISIDALASQLNTSLENGLSSREAKLRLQQHGYNEISVQKPKSIWKIYLEQFLDPVIYLMFAATILALSFGEFLEGMAIITVILLTTIIGFFMEFKATKSMEALKSLSYIHATILRDGKTNRIDARHLVVGDILIIEEGNKVPADARICSTENLSVKESILTGESEHIAKQSTPLPESTVLANRSNMIFKGTIVTRGSAKAMVTAIGDQTELGKISQLGLGLKQRKTPLEKKLNKLSRHLVILTVGLTLLIILLGILQQKDLVFALKTGIALSVAAIPEGLPIVATIALARGVIKLSQQNVIVKRLEAVQTLGEVGILCTDKTGTLTENEMETYSINYDNQNISPIPNLSTDDFKDHLANSAFIKTMETAALCNNADLLDKSRNWDPMEISLLNLVKKTGLSINAIKEEYPEIKEFPFDNRTKLMATVHQKESSYFVFIKGAFENIIAHCTTVLAHNGKEKLDIDLWNKKVESLAEQGLRVLTFAYKQVDSPPSALNFLNDLTLLGLIGFLDPPRKDISPTIKEYHKAGVQVVMVTGDHMATSQKIAEEIGLLGINSDSETVVNSNVLQKRSSKNSKGEKILMNAKVVARVTPEQKLNLIEFYQTHNYVVGMIGDGINDVPALKMADIGIAMGIRGTDAARDASDIILKDDKFTSTKLAIEQGRIIFNNIRQFVVYLLSSNLAEIFSVFIAYISNVATPLLPLQILFLNLVTDVFPALALGLGKGEETLMKDPPRKANEPILTRPLWLLTALLGLSITCAVSGIIFYATHVLKLSDAVINNMGFYTLILAQLLNVFNIPFHSPSFFKNNVITNGWVWASIVLCMLIIFVNFKIELSREILSLTSLTIQQVFVILIFSFSSLLLAQFLKLLFYFPYRKINPISSRPMIKLTSDT